MLPLGPNTRPRSGLIDFPDKSIESLHSNAIAHAELERPLVILLTPCPFLTHVTKLQCHSYEEGKCLMCLLLS